MEEVVPLITRYMGRVTYNHEPRQNKEAMSVLIPAVTKLSSRVIRILGCNPGSATLQGTNTYLIGTGKNRILLDAGEKDVSEYQKNLAEVIKSEDINIEHIVVTHWHHDHIGGVQNLYGTIAKQPIVWKHKKSPEDPPDNELPRAIPNQWLTDGQEITVEGATLKVYHTPGHSSDHVVVSLAEESIIFSGDSILGDRTPTFEEDLLTSLTSLQKILDMKPGLVYPGHGNVVEDPLKEIQYYISHCQKRDDQILEALKNNSDKQLDAMDLVKIIDAETPEYRWPAAAYNVSHHLAKLIKENKVQNINDDGEVRWHIPCESKVT